MKQDELMVTVAGVVRPMNDEEFEQYKKDLADLENAKAKAKAKAEAKEALLAKLGITAEEAALLLS